MRRILAIALSVIALTACQPDGLPPCPTEDSIGCHWDASTQGNGTGRSFDVDSNGTVTYTP